MMANGSFNNWKAIADTLLPACMEGLDTTAKAGKSHVQEFITANNQIRTGEMIGSVYASTPLGSDYQGGQNMLPEIKPASELEAIIGVASDHGIFPNYGTIHQAPKPFFEPGIDQTNAEFEAVLESIAKKLEDAAK